MNESKLELVSRKLREHIEADQSRYFCNVSERVMTNTINDRKRANQISALALRLGLGVVFVIGVNPNWIIPNSPDPISGQQRFMDTVVTVAKAGQA